MKLIAHRGNFNGKDSFKENTIKHIHNSLSVGLDVEIDIRLHENNLYFGHDNPQEQFFPKDWEKYKSKLWVHCKDIHTAQRFKCMSDWNFFIHDNDIATLTSKNIIWCHPKAGPVEDTVLVDIERKFELKGLYGVCSDNLLNLIE